MPTSDHEKNGAAAPPSPGTLAWVIRSLSREAHAAPPSFILVEYSHEMQRADALKQLREALAPDKIPVHEILLHANLKGSDDAPVRHLLEMLDHEPAGAVVFVSQFEQVLPESADERAKVLALFNWYRESLAERPLHQVWWVTPAVAALIARAIPDLDSWFMLRLNLIADDAHARATLDESGWRESDEKRQALLNEAVRLYAEASRLHDEGLYSQAIPLAREALRIREHILGEADSETLDALNLLAILFRKSGDFATAEPLFRRCFETCERTLGPQHPMTLSSVNTLANLLSDQGDFPKAEPLFRRALETRERVFGLEHPDTLNSLGNLASLLRNRADLDGAEPLYQRALEAQERTLGADHSDTLVTLINLAGLMFERGDLDSAESLFRRVLTTTEIRLGPEHPTTLLALNGLASVLGSKGDSRAAEALQQRVVEALERALGLEHPDTLASINNLAVSRLENGEPAAAEPLFRRVLETRERTLGAEHPDTLLSLNNLAAVFAAKGDFPQAEALAQRAAQGLRKLLPANHSRRQKAEQLLADIQTKRVPGSQGTRKNRRPRKKPSKRAQ